MVPPLNVICVEAYAFQGATEKAKINACLLPVYYRIVEINDQIILL